MTVLSSRPPARVVLALMASLGAVIAATGIVQVEAFQYPSNLKYVLSILAPLLVLAACTVERPLRVITATIIVAVPFVGATAQIAGTRVSVLTPLLLAGALIASVTAPPEGRRASLATAGLLAFPLLAIPLAMGSSNRPFITTLALLLAVAWIVSRTAEDPGGMKVVIGAVAVSAAIQGVIAIWQARTGHQLNIYSSAGTQQFASNYFYTYGTTRRPTGAMTDPISLGNVLAISLPPISALALLARRWSVRLLLIAAALLTGTALALSLSRMSWIGAIVGLIVAAALLPRGIRRAITPVLITGVTVIAAVALVLAGPAVRGRLASLQDPTTVQGQSVAQRGVAQGDRNRVEYWRVAMEDGFMHHPVSGVGIDNMGAFLRDRVARSGAGIRTGTTIFIHAHSTYFQLLGEGGLFALALLVLLLRGMFRDVRAGLRAHPVLAAGLAGGVVALLICWTTDWVIHNEPVAASVGILLGAVAGAARSGNLLVSGRQGPPVG